MTNFEVSELLREIRHEIGQLDVRSAEALRVRARALTVLLNASSKLPPDRSVSAPVSKQLSCRWCRAGTGHNVRYYHAYGE